VEVVAQQTVSVSIRHRLDVLGVKLHEVMVIAFFQEYIFAVVAAIIDMVELAVIQSRGGGHGQRSRRPERFFTASWGVREIDDPGIGFSSNLSRNLSGLVVGRQFLPIIQDNLECYTSPFVYPLCSGHTSKEEHPASGKD
jgi:hypothetical protein